MLPRLSCASGTDSRRLLGCPHHPSRLGKTVPIDSNLHSRWFPGRHWRHSGRTNGSEAVILLHRLHGLMKAEPSLVYIAHNRGCERTSLVSPPANTTCSWLHGNEHMLPYNLLSCRFSISSTTPSRISFRPRPPRGLKSNTFAPVILSRS